MKKEGSIYSSVWWTKPENNGDHQETENEPAQRDRI